VHVLLAAFRLGVLESGDDELLSSSHGFDVGAVSDEPVADWDSDLPLEAIVLVDDFDVLPRKKRVVGDDVALDVGEMRDHVSITVLVVERTFNEMVHASVPGFL